MKLFAPEEYWNLTPEQKVTLINGCGPGGWKGKFIPDNIFFLDISECCSIHDYLYAVGASEKDREEADRVFMNNMMRVIEETPQNWIMRRWRRRLALEYYQQVRDFGAIYFWEGKNPEATLRKL